MQKLGAFVKFGNVISGLTPSALKYCQDRLDNL